MPGVQACMHLCVHVFACVCACLCVQLCVCALSAVCILCSAVLGVVERLLFSAAHF